LLRFMFQNTIFGLMIGLSLITTLQAFSMKEKLKCVACEIGVDLVRPHVNQVQSPVVDLAIPTCIVENGEGECDPTTSEGPWACKDLCNGMMKEESFQLVDLVKSFSSKQICQNFAGACDSSSSLENSAKPSLGPPQILSNLSDTRGERQDWDSWKNPTGTFVHMTDLHLQLDFVENSSTSLSFFLSFFLVMHTILTTTTTNNNNNNRYGLRTTYLLQSRGWRRKRWTSSTSIW